MVKELAAGLPPTSALKLRGQVLLCSPCPLELQYTQVLKTFSKKGEKVKCVSVCVGGRVCVCEEERERERERERARERETGRGERREEHLNVPTSGRLKLHFLSPEINILVNMLLTVPYTQHPSFIPLSQSKI